MQNSMLGTLGKRVVAYLVLIFAGLVALKLIAMIFLGAIQAIFMVFLVIAASAGAVWAVRHV